MLVLIDQGLCVFLKNCKWGLPKSKYIMVNPSLNLIFSDGIVVPLDKANAYIYLCQPISTTFYEVNWIWIEPGTFRQGRT